MAQLEIAKEGNCLSHAYQSINFEADIGNMPSRVYTSHYILGDDVNPWCLCTLTEHARLVNQLTFQALIELTFLYYHISGGSDYANRKSKDEGKASCKQQSPPRHLDILFQEDAKCKGDYNCHKKQHMKPPCRYVLVVLHQSSVNIFLSLIRGLVLVINLPARDIERQNGPSYSYTRNASNNK